MTEGSPPRGEPMAPLKAYLVAATGADNAPGTDRIEVHFNPESLRVNRTAAAPEQGRGSTQSTGGNGADLSVDLVFDTTDTGEDVQVVLERIRQLIQPSPPAATPPGRRGRTREAPPLVWFCWGSFQFRGALQSMSSTLDFWTPSGVPLRAAVSLSIKERDPTPASAAGSASTGGKGADLAQPQPPVSAAPDPSSRPGATAPSAGPSGGASSAGVSASGGAFQGLGAGGRAGLSLSASLGASVGASLGASLGASAGLSVGLSARADVGAGVSLKSILFEEP